MPVIIIESPNKVKKLAAISHMRVLSTVGHFKDLPQTGLGVDTQNNYSPTFVVSPDKKDILDKIKSACCGETIYIASDPDREGFAIGTMVYEEIRKTAKYIWRLEIHEITEAGFKQAMAAKIPFEKTNGGLFNAFLGRRISDRIVGYTLSPITSNAIGATYSVGRVQSPAVRLVADREKEITSFQSHPFWTINIIMEKDGEKFTATDVEGHYDYKEEAEEALQLMKADHAICIKAEKKETQSKPKPPFTTVDLQAAAGTQLKINPERTMQLAQQLFEAGLITYHRTDSVRISPEFITEIRNLITQEYGQKYLPSSPHQHKSKNSQADAHEGIRPTHIHAASECSSVVCSEGLGDEHMKLYELIFKRTISSQMSAAIYYRTDYIFKVPHEGLSGGGYDFKASGKTLVFDGYLRLWREQEDSEEQDNSLPDIAHNETVKKLNTELKEGFTKPPARFTEPTLIKKLEELGIGRPSTYASIIGTIKKRKYVKIEKGKLVATPDGVKLSEFLKANHPWVVDYSMTKQMEAYLDEVEARKKEWQPMVRDIHSRVGFHVSESRATGKPSEKQLEYAHKLSERTGINIPEEALESSQQLMKYIDKAKKIADKTYKDQKTSKALSDKQLAIIEKNAPDIFRKVQAGDLKAGYSFLEKFFKKKR